MTAVKNHAVVTRKLQIQNTPTACIHFTV